MTEIRGSAPGLVGVRPRRAAVHETHCAVVFLLGIAVRWSSTGSCARTCTGDSLT